MEYFYLQSSVKRRKKRTIKTAVFQMPALPEAVLFSIPVFLGRRLDIQPGNRYTETIRYYNIRQKIEDTLFDDKRIETRPQRKNARMKRSGPMGNYGSQKAEYLTGFSGIFKFYSHFFLPVFLLYSIVNITWSCTVSGYDQPIYFLFDAILLMLGFASFISLYNMDKYALFMNVLFLLALCADKVYRTAELLPLLEAAISAQPDPSMGMGMGMGMDMMGGSMMGGEMEAAAPVMPDVPVSFCVSILFTCIAAISAGIASSPGFLKFLVISESEIFIGLLLMCILCFVANGSFFFKTLPQLRENENA